MKSREEIPIKRSRAIRLPVPENLPVKESATKWDKDYVRQVFFLCLLGSTDVQIAQIFGVKVVTIDLWKRTHPEFLAAMRQGKTDADTKVVHSLYLAAIGYSHPYEMVIPNRVKRYSEKGKLVEEYTEPLIVKTTKSYPPNVTAAIKWLQARQSDTWGAQVHIKGNIQHNHTLDMSQFSLEELKILKKLGVSDVPTVDATYEEIDD